MPKLGSSVVTSSIEGVYVIVYRSWSLSVRASTTSPLRSRTVVYNEGKGLRSLTGKTRYFGVRICY
jgi:hypothetical protein